MFCMAVLITKAAKLQHPTVTCNQMQTFCSITFPNNISLPRLPTLHCREKNPKFLKKHRLASLQ